jgi:hypothetical protein
MCSRSASASVREAAAVGLLVIYFNSGGVGRSTDPGERTTAGPQPRNMDAVVLKIEARTGRIVWATRTGGSRWIAAGDLEVGKDRSVYVLGQTESDDFQTTADRYNVSSGDRVEIWLC